MSTLYGKVSGMETNWAAEHLQTIRTLMERSAVYRRALAPIMTFVGAVGTAAALLGWAAKIESPRAFIVYWAVVAAVAMGGSFFLVRRQALKDSEPFWSPPTRRITQAFLPPLMAGFIIGAIIFAHVGAGSKVEFKALGMNVQIVDPTDGSFDRVIAMLWLPLIWVVLYGCAFHAAGFFMPRGMKIFGWLFILGGCGAFAAGIPDNVSRLTYAHGIMGLFFGALHLAYGFYLFFTEKRRNET
jgi:hypothetical protein